MKNDAKTLLIWWTQESVDLYAIPADEYEKYGGLIEQAHGKLINVDDINEGMEFLSNALCENPEHVAKEHAQYGCIFAGFKIEASDSPVYGNFSRVISSGFYL